MKLKIVRPNPEFGWWYNKHIGEEFEIVNFSYYRNGSNHNLNIESNKELMEYSKIYDVHIHVKSQDYYQPQVFLEHTNLDLRYMRMEKLRSLGLV